jgi:hypothetical protein
MHRPRRPEWNGEKIAAKIVRNGVKTGGTIVKNGAKTGKKGAKSGVTTGVAARPRRALAALLTTSSLVRAELNLAACPETTERPDAASFPS